MPSAAQRVLSTFEDLMGGPLPIHVRCWAGSEAGPPDSAARVVFRNRRALRRILWSPNELGLTRAYVSGDLDVDGDIFALLEVPISSPASAITGSAHGTRPRLPTQPPHFSVSEHRGCRRGRRQLNIGGEANLHCRIVRSILHLALAAVNCDLWLSTRCSPGTSSSPWPRPPTT